MAEGPDMMTHPIRTRAGLFAIVCLVTLPAAVNGQELAIPFEQLRNWVHPGDTIHVTDASGRKIRVVLRDLSPTTMESLMRDVREISVERRDSLWSGTLIGLAAAGIPWLVVCGANDWCYYNEYGGENVLRKAALVTVAMGAGIGALIDASIKRRTTIYRGSGPHSLKMRLGPFISTEGAGIQTSLQF
jgi:hypothetical protein